MNETSNRPASESRPAVWEIFLLALLTAAFLAANIATASRSPTVWYDETCFVDPAASLALGQGFKTAAWYHVTREQTFTGFPLHQLLLAHWLKLTGFGVAEARSMNYVLMAGAGWLLWLAGWRLNLIRTAWTRLALVALVWSGYGITFVYRSGRIDSLHIFLTAAFLAACAIRTGWLRGMTLFAIAALVPLSGAQFIAFTAVVGALVLLFAGRVVLPELTALAMGGAFGCAMIYFLWTMLGVFDSLAESTGGFFLKFGTPTGLADPSLVALLAASVIVGWRLQRQSQLKLRSVFGFGVVAALIVPLAVAALGRYPIYYSWMGWLPLALGFCAGLSRVDFTGRAWLRWGAVLAVGAVCGVGLPARAALTLKEWKERDYEPVRQLAKRNVQSADWVYADYPAFYAVKPLAGLTMLPPYRQIIRDEEKRRVTVLMIKPDNFAEVAELLGGEWERVDGYAASNQARRGLGAEKYNLGIWRRVEP
jgi:hypothetical protein